MGCSAVHNEWGLFPQRNSCHSSVLLLCTALLQLAREYSWIQLNTGAGNEKAIEGQTSQLKGARVITTMFVNGVPQTAIEMIEVRILLTQGSGQ